MRKFIIPICISLMLFSCDEEELVVPDDSEDIIDDIVQDEEDESQFTAYEEETFQDLTTADFDNIVTPFEAELSTLAGARTTDSLEDLEMLIAELFSANVIESYEDTERGLSVYTVKLLLADGTIAHVQIVQDIFEILSIEAIPSDEITSNLEIQGFVSLVDAMASTDDLIEGTVVRWEISLEEENTLEFEIHLVDTDGTRYEIELNATTGDLLAQKIFENEEDVAAFEEEVEEVSSDSNTDIINALANFITADILFASTETNVSGVEVWNVLAETSGGALLTASIDTSTKELISAEGNQGPFDYDINFLTDGVSFETELATVEGQMNIEVDSWIYQTETNGESEYWGLTFYSTDTYGNLTTVSIDAASGEWIDNSTTPSEAFMNQLDSYVSGDISYASFYENDGNPFWDITFETDADGSAQLKLLIYEESYEIMRAYHDDEEADVNYSFSFGDDASVDLTGAITVAEDEFVVDIEVYDWIYHNSLEVDNEDYSVVLLSVSDESQNIYTVYVDVLTGNHLKTDGLF
ncbi:PepSY domain-containing protein [Reichenbachiella sp.]|uniref:PepSY domain-containing protein n=1 Tax=Reichenbachiella sp. TaxID=2184521 RepID=UPI003BAE4E89